MVFWNDILVVLKEVCVFDLIVWVKVCKFEYENMIFWWVDVFGNLVVFEKVVKKGLVMDDWIDFVVVN